MLQQFNELEKIFSELQGKQPDLFKRLVVVFNTMHYEILKTISRAGSWEVVCRLQGQSELLEKIIVVLKEGEYA